MPINVEDKSVIIGASDIVELAPRRFWTRADGVVSVRRFAGPKLPITERFNSLVATADNGADELEETIEGGKGELLIRVNDDSGGVEGGNTEALNAIWELQNIEVMKPIETATYFSSLTGTQKNTIQKNVREGAACSVIGSVAAKLYAYLSHQYLDYAAYALSLRKTFIVSNRNAVTLNYAGINTVVTLPTVPTALLGALPTGWEWLYKGPQCRQVTKTKFQLVSEWLGLDKWAKYPYGGTWDPS